MTQDLIILIVSLVVIIIAAEVFTNAIESFGGKLKFSEGVTGSIAWVFRHKGKKRIPNQPMISTLLLDTKTL